MPYKCVLCFSFLAIALDENIANYYMEHLVEEAEEGQKFSLYKRMEMSGKSHSKVKIIPNCSLMHNDEIENLLRPPVPKILAGVPVK